MYEINNLAILQRYLLLPFLNDESTSKEFKDSIRKTFPTIMMYKSQGRIIVDDIEKAKSVLQDYLDIDAEYLNELCPNPFFATHDGENTLFAMVHTYKLQIPKLDVFLNKLIDNGVVLFNYDFDQNRCEECRDC